MLENEKLTLQDQIREMKKNNTNKDGILHVEKTKYQQLEQMLSKVNAGATSTK